MVQGGSGVSPGSCGPQKIRFALGFFVVLIHGIALVGFCGLRLVEACWLWCSVNEISLAVDRRVAVWQG